MGHIGEGLIGPTLIHFGSAQQKKQFLPEIVAGRDMWIHVDWDVLEPGYIPAAYRVGEGLLPHRIAPEPCRNRPAMALEPTKDIRQSVWLRNYRLHN